ncbi:hypothetical protein AMATHDRAFT_11406 [Amanita thiersii Skay4041]|uniref:Uncharacterized protein n=1 Tax=Amanita thiersii Skay4041 TaxID=703135 RepID=A0A2A9N6F4_9AGAR|nr:hypothetical protein AMATHDRAFT_11406 [Amanita thiersii Skay4041]
MVKARAWPSKMRRANWRFEFAKHFQFSRDIPMKRRAWSGPIVPIDVIILPSLERLVAR